MPGRYTISIVNASQTREFSILQFCTPYWWTVKNESTQCHCIFKLIYIYIYNSYNHVWIFRRDFDDGARSGMERGIEKVYKECTIYNTSHGISRFSCQEVGSTFDARGHVWAVCSCFFFFHFFIAFPVLFLVDNEARIIPSARPEGSHEKYMRGLSKFPKFRGNWDAILIRARVFDRSSQFKIPMDNELLVEYIIESLIEGADGRRKCFDIIITLLERLQALALNQYDRVNVT